MSRASIHTPAPWMTNGSAIETVAEPSYVIASVYEGDLVDIDSATADANAAFIVQAVNAHGDLVAALDQIFSRVSYVNIHGVGEQPDPSPLGPQPVRVSKEEFSRLFQEIGTIAAAALAKAAQP